MGRFPSKHRPSPDRPSSSGPLKNSRAQVCQEVDFRIVRKFFLVSTVVLALASIAVPDLHADDVYPNCIVTAIDPNSGVITSQETGTGKIFYFQVTIAAQLEHVRIQQGIWIKNGQVSFDGVKPCACKVVNSPADVPADANSKVPASTGPVSSAAKPSSEATTNAAGESTKPGKSNQTSGTPQTGARTMSPTQAPLISKSPTSAAGSDVLVLRDGKRKSGSLAACGLNTCRMGTSVVPRPTIQWIGLSQNKKLQAAPPIPKSSATDEVHLADGSIHSETVLGIRATSVEVAGQSYDRKIVKWVYLALLSAGQKPAGFEDDTPPEKPGNTKNPPPPPPPPSGSSAPSTSGRGPRPRAPGEAVKACPADKPLGGHIEIDSDWNNMGCRGSRRAVLRFPLIPLGVNSDAWHIQLWGGFTAPKVHYELTTGGCSGAYQADPRSFCNAPSGSDAADVVLGQGGGPGGFIPVPDSDGFLHFYPVKPEIAASTLLYHETYGGGVQGTVTPLECPVPTSGGSGGSTSWSFDFGGLDIEPADPNCLAHLTDSDYGKPFNVCVQPSECSKPSGASIQRDCMLHADRHAVIPFEGEEHWQSPKASDPRYSGVLSAKVHWEICCGCGDAPAPPQTSNDPCPSTTEADNRLKTNRIKRQLALLELDEHGAAYEEALKEANAHYPDYMKTVEGCLVQDAATDALIAMLAPELVTEETPEAVAHAIEWAEQKGLMPPMGMQLIAKIIDKIIGGEDPTTAIDREGKQVWAETFDAINKVETLFDATRTAAGMEKTAEQCQGAFLVSAETKLSADKCVESFKAALAQLVEINKLQNKIRDLDTEYPDLQYKAWAACVSRARCKGTPESDCDNKKPPGNWPPVP